MATPAIIRGSNHFFNAIYEGNGGGQRVGKFIPFTDNGTIAKSCLFNDDDSAYLNRTSGTATSTRIFTVSVWAKRANIGTHTILNLAPLSGSTNAPTINWGASATIQLATSGGSTMNKVTTRTFEDTSKWYHIVARFDTTQSTAADRVRLYVDGDQITDFGTNTIPSQNADFVLNSQVMQIGRATSGGSATQYLDGYLAELHYADGQSYGPDTFGITDTSTGRWIPKSLGSITYGNNGFRMEFANSAGQTIGDDTSGNTNDFTVNNIATTDIVTDSPTNNFLTFTTNGQVGSNSLAEGNLKPTFPSGTGASAIPSTFRIPVGKWYFEYYIPGTNSVLLMMAVAPEDTNFSGRMHTLSGFKTIYPYTRTIYEGSSSLLDESNMPLAEDDTTVGVYIERKTDGTVNYWVGDDQASKGTFAYSYSGNPATGANPVASKFRSDENLKLFTGSDGNGNYSSGVRGVFNFGQLKSSPIDSGTALTDYTSTAGGFFRYQPADGFKALSQDNLPDNSKDLADFVWIKNRDQADDHALYDSSRGPLNEWHINEDVPAAVPDGLTKFLKGGFAVEDDVTVNSTGESYVAWCWHANGGTTAANTAGSGANVATTVQANQTAGFSICEFTGTGSNLRFAHGLSQAPEWIIIKRLEGSGAAQQVYHVGYGADKYVQLNESDALVSTGAATTNFIETPTATYVDLGSNSNSNSSGDKSVAYCWHSVAGFSKFGIYLGNGSSNGPIIITGFKPAWIMFKETGNSNNWPIWDNKRFPLNPTNNSLFADLNQADNGSSIDMDVLSNGFKPRTNNSQINRSGGSYIYMAFAEHPFVGDGTNPATAR